MSGHRPWSEVRHRGKPRPDAAEQDEPVGERPPAVRQPEEGEEAPPDE